MKVRLFPPSEKPLLKILAARWFYYRELLLLKNTSEASANIVLDLAFRVLGMKSLTSPNISKFVEFCIYR